MVQAACVGTSSLFDITDPTAVVCVTTASVRDLIALASNIAAEQLLKDSDSPNMK